MRQDRRCGVTLIELLVVVAIIGLLVALLLPAVQAAREAARRSRCQSNLNQIGAALHSYHGAQRHFPVGCIEKRVPATKPAGRQLAWSAELLGHLEEESLWKQVNFTSAYDSAANASAAVVIVATFLCPSTVRMASGREGVLVINVAAGTGYQAAAIDYGGIYGAAQVDPSANGVFLYDRAIEISDITDGTSHTLAIAEDSGRGRFMNGEWINGENIYDVGGQVNKQQDNEIWSDHPGGAMALSCDGSVTFLDESIDLAALRGLCTRAGSKSLDVTE